MKVRIFIYNEEKYKRESKLIDEVNYTIVSYEVVTGERATEIGLETDEESQDKYNEYLILTLENGETATFGNSNVDMFRIR